MRFKVGDRVKVKRYVDMKKDDLESNVIGGVVFVDDMHECCGKSATITHVCESDSAYFVDICNYHFSDEMLEPIDYKAYFDVVDGEYVVIMEYRGERRKFSMYGFCKLKINIDEFESVTNEWIDAVKDTIDSKKIEEESKRIKVGDIVRIDPETITSLCAYDWIEKNVRGKRSNYARGECDMSYFWDVGNCHSFDSKYKVLTMDDSKAYIMSMDTTSRAYVVDIKGLHKGED